MTVPASCVLTAVLAAIASVGCGTETLDSAEAEDTVKSLIQAQTGANVTSVDCPDDVKAEQGTSFACEVAAADGSKSTIDVEQNYQRKRQLSVPYSPTSESLEEPSR